MHVGAENLAWSALPVLFPVQVGERVQALPDEVRLDGRTSVRLPSTRARAEHGIVEKLFHARPYGLLDQARGDCRPIVGGRRQGEPQLPLHLREKRALAIPRVE